MKNWDREFVGPLNPRDAFFGGRTITKLTYDFKEGEKGKYVDFVSLYPTVQYYKRYPVGHATKLLEPQSFDKHWFGFIKCMYVCMYIFIHQTWIFTKSIQ